MPHAMSQIPFVSRRPSLWIPVACLLASLPGIATGDDWPQWRGPQRTGAATLFEPPGDWPGQLTLRWKTEVGQADSAPVIAGGKAIVFSRVGGREDASESLSAFDLESGELMWRQSYEAPYKPISIVGEHASGPFSTPLVKDGRIFTFGIAGVLTAWSLQDGNMLWQRSFEGQFKWARPFYGASQSPLFADGKLIQHVGGPGDGALMAFDPATGADVWRFDTAGPAYGSGIVAELGGRRQVVTFTQRTLVGVALDSGEPLWEEPYQVTLDVTNLTPTLIDGKVVISAADTPIRAYEPTRSPSGEWSVRIAWENRDVWMDYSSPVVIDGRLFGFASQKKGQLVELSPSTGELLWSGEPRSGEVGWLLVAADVLLLVTDSGDLSVFRPDERGATRIAGYEVADSTVWAHPALVQQGLLVKDKAHLALWSIVPD